MSKEYVNWYKEKTEDSINKDCIDINKHIVWSDIVTKTDYYLNKKKYKEIMEEGIKYLNNKGIKEIEELYYENEKFENINLKLFSELPYYDGKIIKPFRICDYISLRIGLLYVLEYENIENKSGIKDLMRLEGFTCSPLFETYKTEFKFKSKLDEIDKILLSDSEVDLNIYGNKIDIVKGGMIKIKQYYLETDGIPEIRGASIILDYVNDEVFKGYISEEHIPECVVYTGGGKIFGIFPKGKGEEVKKDLGKIVEKYTITAQYNFISYETSIEDITRKYSDCMKNIDSKLEEQKNLRWDFRMEPKLELIEEDDEFKNDFNYLNKDEEILCECCRHRYSVAQMKKEPKNLLCPSCLRKKLYGGKNAKNKMSIKYSSYIKDHFDVKVEKRDNKYNSLDDIAGEDGSIGVIYGDANNMSKVINKINSLAEMKYFSYLSDKAIFKVVFKALSEVLKDKASFEVIAIGGDDIFIVVPGDKAYDISLLIGEEFDKFFKNKLEDESTITMSLGTCIAHANMPMKYLSDISQGLLKRAKTKAYKKNDGIGVIEWLNIKNSTHGTSSLDRIYMNIEGKPIKTLRPYNWTEASAMKKFINNIKDERSFAFNLSQTWYNCSEKEANLFYENHICSVKSKKEKEKLETALNSLAKAFKGKVNGMNIEIDEKIYAPWIDAVELWDHIEGEDNGESKC